MDLITWQTIGMCCPCFGVVFSGLQDCSVEKVAILFAIAKGKQQSKFYFTISQNKEGILPVATVSIALCFQQIYVSQRRRAIGDNFVIGFINNNKYTFASENVHFCLRKNRQLGHISIATGRIPSLSCSPSLFLPCFVFTDAIHFKTLTKMKPLYYKFFIS